MSAAAAFDVEGVDRASIEDAEGVGDRQALVEAVGVQRDLHVVLLGDAQRGVERASVRAGVLVHLEPADAALLQRLEQRGVDRRRAATEEADVDRPRVERGERVAQPPGGVDADAPHRAELLAEDRRDAGRERGLHDARRHQVHVGVDGARRGDQALAADDGGAVADDDVDAVEGVAGCPPGRSPLIRPSRMPIDTLRMPSDRVEHQDVGDDEVARLA